MSAFPPVAELLPHAGGMLLLDAILAETDASVRSAVTIRADSVFFATGLGVPSYVGFEFMAQTISAYDGLRRRRGGMPPAIGFLLGCRKYEVTVPYFAEGQTLAIEVTSLLGEEAMSSFECVIFDADAATLASAAINIYRPADAEAFLQAQQA